MQEKRGEILKFIAEITCILGGFASFLTWLGVKPKDLAMSQSMHVPHFLWLLLAIALFVAGISSSLWGILGQKLRIKSIQSELALERQSTERLKGDIYENAQLNLEYRDKLGTFSALQWDALSLSLRLLNFIEAQGPPPQPKYSADEVRRMPLDMNDKDLDFACEFHFGGNVSDGGPQTSEELQKLMMARFMILDPWYEKVRASYALEFRSEVERMYNRFSIEGFTDDVLDVPVQGKMGRENIRAIASKLWELAYKVREKGISIENP